LIEFPRVFKQSAPPERKRMAANAWRLGYVDGAVGDAELVARLAALFPDVVFESVGAAWPDSWPSQLDILIVSVDGASPAECECTLRRLRTRPPALHVVVVVRRANTIDTRVIARYGASDVLAAPVSEAALALSIERLLARDITLGGAARRPGQMVALLKAGGGVGATSLAVQIAALLAAKAPPAAQVCVADLDLQFGTAALYFDLQDALTITDCLPVGDVLDETQFATVLATHKSGARVLAAPRQLTALDALSPQLAESLISGLRSDFALTIMDLPSVWTPWTYRSLQLADRIVIVTQLSVPHVHFVRRQLAVLALQKLDDRPIVLVCNGLSTEQQKSISVKAAQRAIGRDFDFVVPEDRPTMIAAINQGVGISSIRRATKLEKAIDLLADALAADALAEVPARTRG
jgi:pilus assembly protein CpaE